MPGPFVHQASMENCSELLSQIGINVNPGNLVDNMRADLDLDSHGYSFEINSGTILEKISDIADEIKQVYITNNKSFPDYDWFQYKCRLICHLCTDSFSIGQISNELWGSKDDKIDACSEFVIDKKKYVVFRNDFNYTLSLSANHISTMRNVYDTYKSKAKKWNFCISKDLVNMVRNAVKYGGEFGYSWINWAVNS
jgi:hypothetical protein